MSAVQSSKGPLSMNGEEETAEWVRGDSKWRKLPVDSGCRKEMMKSVTTFYNKEETAGVWERGILK
jgi:hypothetical protein